jgi:Cu+-exporting ATPase
MQKIKQNLGWAFAYNLIGIPLAAGALLPTAGIVLTPSIAGALMGVSSLAVMGNSLTLQFDRGPRREGTEKLGGKAEGGKKGEEGGAGVGGVSLQHVVVAQEAA